MSLSAELAELYRTEPTGSKMLAALTRRYANRSSTVAVFHKVQRLEEELRHCRYDVTEDIEVHLRRMRNKQIELTDLGHTVSLTTMMMYVLQSLPAKIDKFALIQTQNWCGNSPASDIDELEEQIRTASSRYQIRRSFYKSDERDACGDKTKAHCDKKQNRQRYSKVKKNGAGAHRTETRTCHGCGKPGHLKRDCPNAVDSEDNKGKRSRAMFTVQAPSMIPSAGNAEESKAHLIEDDVKSLEDHMVIATTFNTVGEHIQDKEPQTTLPIDYHWCFDTGANVHVTSVREAFVTYDPAPPIRKQVCQV